MDQLWLGMSHITKFCLRVIQFTVITTVAYGLTMAFASRFNLEECLYALGISFCIGLVLSFLIGCLEKRKAAKSGVEKQQAESTEGPTHTDRAWFASWDNMLFIVHKLTFNWMKRSYTEYMALLLLSTALAWLMYIGSSKPWGIVVAVLSGSHPCYRCWLCWLFHQPIHEGKI